MSNFNNSCDLKNQVIMTVFCIDKRFDFLTTDYFQKIGLKYNYYLLTTAGSSLCLGYENYCKNICNCNCNCDYKNNLIECNPDDSDMHLLKKNIIKNIEIALSLDPLEEVYLLNHQDCGAIKAYLGCSGYPQKLGENNQLEIQINIKLLNFAKEYIENTFKNIKNIKLGLIDINGTVADYDAKYCSWNLIFRGNGNDIRGIWFGL